MRGGAPWPTRGASEMLITLFFALELQRRRSQDKIVFLFSLTLLMMQESIEENISTTSGVETAVDHHSLKHLLTRKTKQDSLLGACITLNSYSCSVRSMDQICGLLTH